MTSDWHASSWHRHDLYFAALPYFYAPHHHSSFLIPHSSKAFIHNQWTEPPKGLTPNTPIVAFPSSCYTKIIQLIEKESNYEISI